LVKYKKENNDKLPEKIAVFRDGVSDGQFEIVKEHEIPQIKLAFSLIDIDYK
jgi:eukaryotic translation initiation factor 2C